MYSLLNSKLVSCSYHQWAEYFRKNAKKRLKICFVGERDLDEDVKKLIFPSITAFERGECSEGIYLKAAAEKFSEQIRDPAYAEAMKLFIGEENTHSAYLAKYMRWHGVVKREKTPLNKIFQILRRSGGIRSEVTVLVTAEIIALSYYTALGNATDSKALKSICRQMLHDELPHVVFQSYTLSHFHSGVTGRLIRILLMEISCLTMWAVYRKVLRAGGYTFWKFFGESLCYLHQSIQLASR